MSEKLFYNALNRALHGNYKKLEAARARSGSWEKAWHALAPSQKTGIQPETEWKKLETLGIELFLIDDATFPGILKEIHLPPLGLYVRGILGKEELTCAIVGTRKATVEGKATAEKFAHDLARRGFAIISGLALGIDAAAHEGCLAARGRTIAVLGNGLDHIYPQTNQALAENILKHNGALLSEYPPDTPSYPSQFLERNRIVSGLARGTVVIEAPEKSGSLVTARLAMEQNREVFVVPGPISHPNFKGSNRLIREGAELVTTPEDICTAFGLAGKPEKALGGLESEEEKLVCAALLKLAAPADVDSVAELARLSIPETNKTLSFLIIKNVVKETEGGYTLTN